MPIHALKLNNGTLTLGETPLDFSCQLTSFAIVPAENVTTEDAIPVLCGETLPRSDTVDVSFTMEGTFLQDIYTGGILEYSYTHRMEEVPFAFTPDNDVPGTAWEGTVRIVPLKVGGDVSTRPTSDFTWTIIGTPTPTFAAAPVAA